ncbi:DUF4893 domain-containing protein [Aestuariibius sp. 2305UL40-4]|uniref:DUF4893 domain-containing protein n=1 Tax=Aestuariibius violaceus TaxID=3234132 RepID=UPI00345E0F96
MKALFALLLTGSAAFADPAIRPADMIRFDQRDANLGAALRIAFAAGAAQDTALLTEALSGLPNQIAPEGDWNCRILKLGGLLSLTTYPNFRCRFTRTGPNAWRIEKLTGSQRFVGDVHGGDGEAIFLGVGHVGDAPATDYAGLPPGDQTPVEPNQTTAEIGVFEQMGPTRARLLLPDPILESDFDIVYFTR